MPNHPHQLALLCIATTLACAHQIPPIDHAPQRTTDNAPTPAPEIVTELDQRIFHIFQADDSTYWFGSDAQGLYHHDGTQLVRYTSAHGLNGNQVRSIQQDHTGSILVSTEQGGVHRFDGHAFIPITPLDPSLSEWKLQPTDLWFPGDQDSGIVYRWDGTSLHQLTFPATTAGDAHIAEFPRSKYPNAKYSPYDVYTITTDSNGHIWFGTAVLGACRFDGSTFTWVGHNENSSFGVRSILEHKDGSVWLSNTLNRFVPEPNTDTPHYRKVKGIAKDTDPYAVFMSSVTESDGTLWLATLTQGVYRFDGTDWTHYPVTHNNKPIWVYSIYQDQQGSLWVGTHEHGIYTLNANAFKRHTF